MRVRLVHIDGRFPNLALMKLSHYFKLSSEVYFTRSLEPQLWEKEYDLILGSVIFTSGQEKVARLKSYFPRCIVSGPGLGEFPELTVEKFIAGKYENYDYSIYPEIDYSIGFSSRGCRFSCPFCIVPRKEGKIQSVSSITSIWRGEPHPKKLLLLDNDFFGQEDWEEKCLEIIQNRFRVSLCQGINIRTLTLDQARYIKEMRLLDNDFRQQRIYTSWDSIRDEHNFLRGIELLFSVGVKPHHIMVFFLTNFGEAGLTENVWYRHSKLKELGVRQFPMIFGEGCPELKFFQSWVIRRLYYKEAFSDYLKRRRATPQRTELSLLQQGF